MGDYQVILCTPGATININVEEGGCHPLKGKQFARVSRGIKICACVILYLQGGRTITPRNYQHIGSLTWRLSPEKNVFMLHGHHLWVGITLLDIWWMHGMHVFCILKSLHSYKYWYVTQIVSSHISYFISRSAIIRDFFHDTYFSFKFYSISNTLETHKPQTYYPNKGRLSVGLLQTF